MILLFEFWLLLQGQTLLMKLIVFKCKPVSRSPIYVFVHTDRNVSGFSHSALSQQHPASSRCLDSALATRLESAQRSPAIGKTAFGHIGCLFIYKFISSSTSYLTIHYCKYVFEILVTLRLSSCFFGFCSVSTTALILNRVLQ